MEKELDLLTGLVEGKGPLAQATMVQGVYLLKTPLPLPEYYIGLNVYFDKSGKLIYALDMSDTIGEGQKDAYGNPILNVDEDNEGYHALAVATLADYEGLDIKTILNSKLSQLTSIRQVPTAAYHRAGIFQAIQNAAAEAEQLLPKPGTHSEKSSSSESANSKDRGLQSNPKTNRGRHSAILPRTGSKGSFVYGILGYTSVALLSLITAIKRKNIKLI